jgi:anti-sigma factor RsiW
VASDRSGHLGPELIQEALDGRLPLETLAPLEEHLRGCPRCRRSWEAFAWAREQAGRAARLDVPGALADRIRRSLDAEDLRLARRRRNRLFAAILAAGLTGLLAGASLFLANRRDPIATVARDYQAVRSGRLSLQLRTREVKRLEEHFAAARLDFTVRVFDLAMMQYDLVGGSVHTIRGRRGALFVYRARGGEELICQMYPGTLAELPAGGEMREHDGITFAVYQRDGLTLVFWPEGSVVCVLAGPGGPDAVLPLAYAKAARARPQPRA